MKLVPIVTLSAALMASNVLATECSDVEFHQDVIEKYPTIVNACQAVVMQGDQAYIKVVADFVSFRRPNKLTINVHENDGSKERQVMEVKPDMMVMAGNQSVKVSTLPKDYELNFMIPSDRFEFVADESMLADVVEPEPVEAVALLPKTASVWPAVGLAGFAMLCVSQLLAWRRKRS
jgi:hypothetical protein